MEAHDTPLLDTLVIELTNQCNEKCKHCYLPTEVKSAKPELSVEKIRTLIDEFTRMGGESIIFTGGEILIYKNLLEVLEYAHQKGVWIGLFFNAISLSQNQIDKFKEIGVNDIQISLYSIDPKIHDSITEVKGSCERTKKSVTRLLEDGLPVRIACSVLKENMNEICNLLDYSTSLDIKLGLEFNIIAREDGDTDNLQYRLSPEELERCMRSLAEHNPEYVKKYFHRLNRSNKEDYDHEEFLNGPVCGAAQDILYITADGKYSICPGWIIEGSDVHKNQSLKDFWKNNELLNEIRNKKERSFPKCISCEALDYCVRCYARNYLETGDYTQPPEYACQYAFVAKKIVESIS
ncbi:MAG: radical SAM protein [Barnesiella sp.]|nr:radical SAM protein [Barnesiella sp.]